MRFFKSPAILAAAGWLAASRGALAVIEAGPIVNPANGHTYYLLGQTSWSTGERQAQALGGHLVTINNSAENDYVFD